MITSAGWPKNLDSSARPMLSRKVLHTVPYTFGGVAVAMAGIHWTFKRRQDVAAAEEVVDQTNLGDEGPDTEKTDTESGGEA